MSACEPVTAGECQPHEPDSTKPPGRGGSSVNERRAGDSSATTIRQAGDGHDPSAPALYRTSPVKRPRRTKAELAELQDAILTGESVEVDAIHTSVSRRIVEDAIVSHLDTHRLYVHRAVQEQERQGLLAMANGWSA